MNVTTKAEQPILRQNSWQWNGRWTNPLGLSATEESAKRAVAGMSPHVRPFSEIHAQVATPDFDPAYFKAMFPASISRSRGKQLTPSKEKK